MADLNHEAALLDAVAGALDHLVTLDFHRHVSLAGRQTVGSLAKGVPGRCNGVTPHSASTLLKKKQYTLPQEKKNAEHALLLQTSTQQIYI